MSHREVSPQGDSVLGHNGSTGQVDLHTHPDYQAVYIRQVYLLCCGLYLILFLLVLFQKTSVPWGNASKYGRMFSP